MSTFRNMNDLLNQLNKIRKEAILIEVTVPGERWEIEFLEDGTIDIERFVSDGSLYDEDLFNVLFTQFSN